MLTQHKRICARNENMFHEFDTSRWTSCSTKREGEREWELCIRESGEKEKPPSLHKYERCRTAYCMWCVSGLHCIYSILDSWVRARKRERVWQIENVSIFTQRNDESTDFIYSMHTHSPKHVYIKMYSKHDINGSVRSCTYYLHYTSIQLLHVLPEMCWRIGVDRLWKNDTPTIATVYGYVIESKRIENVIAMKFFSVYLVACTLFIKIILRH